MKLGRLAGRIVLGCVALAMLPLSSQAAQERGKEQGKRPETRPAPAARPQQPGNGGNRPNPGGNKPNPGNNRPNPGSNRPNPGNNRPNPGNNRPGGNRPSRPNRPPQWGRPPQNRPSYNFRPNDRNVLLHYYQSRFRSINRARRPRFAIGGFFPYTYIPYISPLPPDLYGTMPPPPPGYSMGYYDGYVVVYDPVSYFIANVIDLLQ